MISPLVTTTFDICRRGYKGTHQNGVGNRVDTLPQGAVGSQRECCERCVGTLNCVAFAWVGPEEEERERESSTSPVGGEQGRRGRVGKGRGGGKEVCQLLIKERPVGSSGLVGEDGVPLPSQRSGRRKKAKGNNDGGGGGDGDGVVETAGVREERKLLGTGTVTNELCPLGVEEYDFGEESPEGTVFRGPCGVPKGV